ncbi:MAG TPA: phospholipase D family protein [Bryobacteraceae bacterium]|nr:phospholipase D family protein [Bryobacteraceae bacterium]
MTIPRLPTGLVRSPWEQLFQQLISAAQHDLILASPFIKAHSADQIVSNLRRRGVEKDIRVMVLTNLRPESLLNGSTDIGALSAMSGALARFELVHLPSLHAKVYVADESVAVVTSANLTPPGITGNLEYGVAFADETSVREIRHDFENYSLLGARIGHDNIEVLLRETTELKAAFLKAERSIRSEFRRAFQKKLEAANLQLLRRRAEGKTTHAIFSDTILFLLARGPLRTIDLNPLIQQIHPDLCDDTIDRVIGGVHFGKRWKHYVRNAQASLKRTGRIHLDGEYWHLGS